VRKTNIAFRLFMVVAMVAGAIGTLIPVGKAAAITTVAVTATPSVAGAQAEYIITFVHTAAGPVGSTITLTFPTGTTLPSTIAKTSWFLGQGANVAAATAAKTAPVAADPDIVVDTTNRTVQVPVIAGQAITAGNTALIQIAQTAGIRNRTTTSIASSFSVASSVGGEVTATGNLTTLAGACNVAGGFLRQTVYSPSTTTQGGSVSVTGAGFTPGQNVTLSSTGAVSGSAVAGTDGSVAITATRSGLAGTAPTLTDGAGLACASAAAVGLLPDLTVIAGGTPNLTDTITIDGRNFAVGSVMAIGTAAGVGIGPGARFAGVAQAAANWVSAVGLGVDGLLGTADDTTIALTDRDTDGAVDDFRITIRAPSSGALATAPTSGVTTITMQTRTAGVDALMNTADDVTGGTATTTVTVNARTVTLSPNTGPVGTQVTVTGTGFPKSQAAAGTQVIGIATGGAAATPNGNIPTDTLGAFTILWPIPDAAAAGARTVTVTIPSTAGDAGAVTGFSSFTVTAAAASIAITPNTGPRGTTVSISGSNYVAAAGATAPPATPAIVAAALTIGGIPFGGAAAINSNADGTLVAATRTIPAGAAYGANTVVGTSGTASPTTSFTVTQPTIAIGTTSGTIGTTINFTGAGWVPNGVVTIRQVGVGAVGVASANAAGAINASLTVPATAFVAGGAGGDINFVADDTTGNSTRAVTFALSAAAATVTASVASGGSITVTGTGFQPGFAVALTFDGAAFPLATPAFTNSVGGFTATIVAPELPGLHTIAATVNAVTRAGNVTITAAASGAGVPVATASALAVFPTGRLQIANVANAAGTAFTAFVPGLPGNAVTQIQPNSVIILTVNADTTVIVSGVSFALTANTPRFIPVGNNVTITIQ